nr:putative reverse transcriptase domain-containing protein [Tanacetum cinerariifolium]
RMRELVMKYKAEKVCHEEMVKMPLVDLKVLEAWWFCLRMLEALGLRDEECDLDGSRASTTHSQLEGLNMRQRRWMELFSDYGCETKYHMEKANIVVDAWRRKRGVNSRRVQDIFGTIQAEISEKMLMADIKEGKMIGLEMEQETTKVVVIKERLKEAKDRIVRFGKKGELAPRYIGAFEILERIGLVAYRLRLPDELSIENYLSGVKTSSKPKIALILNVQLVSTHILISKQLFARLIEEFRFALHRAWLIVVRHESEKTAWPIMVRHAYVKMAK